MLQFCLLGSGSSGNATYVASPSGAVLIDCGFSFKQLQLRLGAVGRAIEAVEAVFITHEHSDHVQGLGILSRKLDIPIYMTAGTAENLPERLGEVRNIHAVEAGESMEVAGMAISSYSVSHDAADPVCYTIAHGGARLGIAHDIGHPNHLVRSRLAGCQALILESNYCPQCLRRGPYPPQVQQRIRSRIGHLSNQDMVGLLSDLLHEGLRTVVLNHISENNNLPEIVERMAAPVIADHPVELILARQDAPTRLLEVAP